MKRQLISRLRADTGQTSQVEFKQDLLCSEFPCLKRYNINASDPHIELFDLEISLRFKRGFLSLSHSFHLSSLSAMGKVIKSNRKGKGSVYQSFTCGRAGAVSFKRLDYAERNGYAKGRITLFK